MLKKNYGSPFYINDIEIINILLFQFANSGKLSNIFVLSKEILGNRKNIMPNLNYYVTALQCMGHMLNANASMTKSEIHFKVERILNDIKKANVNIFFNNNYFFFLF